MLHHGHDLDGVITGTDDPRQHFLLKLAVGGDSGKFAGHADMGFVNQRRFAAGIRRGVFPAVRLRLPHLGIEDLSLLVLHYTPDVSRQPVARTVAPVDF